MIRSRNAAPFWSTPVKELLSTSKAVMPVSARLQSSLLAAFTPVRSSTATAVAVAVGVVLSGCAVMTRPPTWRLPVQPDLKVKVILPAPLSATLLNGSLTPESASNCAARSSAMSANVSVSVTTSSARTGTLSPIVWPPTVSAQYSPSCGVPPSCTSTAVQLIAVTVTGIGSVPVWLAGRPVIDVTSPFGLTPFMEIDRVKLPIDDSVKLLLASGV